jgi:hypothetical protein
LVTALEKAREDRSGCSLQLIRAAGGEGKTTLQLQTAVDLLRGGDWAVLWRANPELPLPIAQLGALDQSHNWLIVADDAENLVSALDEAASTLSAAGRTNIHFLLAARDTDWIDAQGNTTALADRLQVHADLLLQGVNKQDAKAIVTARQAHGEEGLKRLAETKANKRADLLFRAVRSCRGCAAQRTWLSRRCRKVSIRRGSIRPWSAASRTAQPGSSPWRQSRNRHWPSSGDRSRKPCSNCAWESPVSRKLRTPGESMSRPPSGSR